MFCPMVLTRLSLSTSILCFAISNFSFLFFFVGGGSWGKGVTNELGGGTSIQSSCIDNNGNIYINQILVQGRNFQQSEHLDNKMAKGKDIIL